MSNSSFVNGLIAGAGIALSIMSYGFLKFIAPIENQQGVSSTEIRVAIMMGGLVAAAAIAYEYYTKKQESQNNESNDIVDTKSKTDTNDELDE